MSVYWQILRFAAVGLCVNAMALGAYLALTGLGMPPLGAMTVTYCGAMAVSFAMNRNITFAHDGQRSTAFGRYLAAYAAGYVINFAGLVALVGWLHVPHAWAQAVLIVLVAVVMFLMQRFWVFADLTRAAVPMKG